MNSDSAIKLSPIYSDDKKLEVSLKEDKAEIKLSTWTEALGWCGQKTLQIDSDMLNDLHRAIAAARYKVNKREIEETPINAKVLEFPTFT